MEGQAMLMKRKKRKLSNKLFSVGIIFVLCVQVVCSNGMTITAHAETCDVYDGFLYEVTDDGISITGYSGNKADISIPDEIDGKKVTGIGSWAFRFEEDYGSSNITSIIIPDSVTSIGYDAFFGCSNLTSITIPESVVDIGGDAFAYCTSLESIVVAGNNNYYDSRNGCNAIIETSTSELIAGCKNTTIPDNITGIGDCAFYGCSSLSNIVIPDGVTSIGDCAFYGCSSLSNIVIPDGVTSIEDYAFYGCSNLTSITIPESVVYIDEDAFAYCSGLESIVVDVGNEYYDSREDCNAIIETSINELIAGCKNATIPDSVIHIGNDAFLGCSNLTSITIPDGITSIGYGAFKDCSDLTSITIPKSVRCIEEDVFWDCSALESIVVDENNEYYDSRNDCNAIVETSTNKLIVACKNTTIPDSVTDLAGAFAGCSGLTSIVIPYGITSIGDGEFSGCSNLTNITIPDSVTSIVSCAFEECENLTSITIPASVNYIDGDAFSYCNGLESIVVDENNKYYDSREDCNAIIETSTNELIAGCKNTTIPDSVTSIGDDAFFGCGDLTSITIPDSVANIGRYAFAECSNLRRINIPEGLTSIGTGTFWACSSLTHITIPDSVTSIGVVAFEDCSNLRSIIIPDNVTYIDVEAFAYCYKLVIICSEDSYAYTFASQYGISVITSDIARLLGNSSISKPLNIFERIIHNIF